MIKGELAERMQRLVAERVPFVTATVVRAASPTSVRPGDSALVLVDGTIDGFVGGVCAQASVRLYAARALETGEPVILRLMPGTGDGEDAPGQDGLVEAQNPCLSGGTLEIFLEPQLPAARILVAGDTPIARAVADVAAAAGYAVARGAAAELEPDGSDAAVIVASHGDAEEHVLERALNAGVGYVALVASERRGSAVRASLDVPDALREQLHTPAGLEIGAGAPGEIAIAILAELVAKHVARPADAGAPAASGGPGTSAAPVAAAASGAPAAAAASAPASAGEAVDPICGMTVLASEASVHLDVDGERVYFCSEGCRAAYIERNAAAH